MPGVSFSIPPSSRGLLPEGSGWVCLRFSQGNAEKSLSWLFSARKSKSAVFDFLHFQSLTAIENAWPSLASLGSALNQRFPEETLKKSPSWLFSARKSKSAVSDFLPPAWRRLHHRQHETRKDPI
jgi:hypothetical protein